jgi:dethiobiotin synthetase
MSPIAQDGLNIDLMAALALPVVLATANYLGAISHTLTALAALQARGLTVLAVVVQELTEEAPDLADTVAALRLYAPSVTIVAGPSWEAALADAVTGERT